VSPTSRSLAWLREHGYRVAIVERRLTIPGKFVTQDLFGFADLFAISADGECALIQVTSGAHVAARVKKARAIIDASPHLQLSGLRMLVHGWSRLKKTGWTLRIVDLDPIPIPPATPEEPSSAVPDR